MDHFVFRDRKYVVNIDASEKGLERWILMKAYGEEARHFLYYLTFLYNISTREFTIDFEADTIKEMLYTNEAINDGAHNITFYDVHKETIWQLAISKVPGLLAINEVMYQEDAKFLEEIKSEIAEDPDKFHEYVNKAIIDSMI